jgi:hypothetical protein
MDNWSLNKFTPYYIINEWSGSKRFCKRKTEFSIHLLSSIPAVVLRTFIFKLSASFHLTMNVSEQNATVLHVVDQLQSVQSNFDICARFCWKMCAVQNQIDESFIGFSLLSLTLIFVTTLSTIFDAVSQKFNRRWTEYFTIFSLVSNYKEFVRVNKSDSVIKCINSIKVLTTFWIIMGHRQSYSNYTPGTSLFDQFVTSIYAEFMRGVTIFFTCSGILAIQSVLKALER